MGGWASGGWARRVSPSPAGLDRPGQKIDHGGVSVPRAVTVAVEGVAALIAIVAVTYLVVACESLPGLLGPVAGDTHPRTKLGAALLVVAVLLAAGGVIVSRMPGRRR
jgi:hypothetical protein